MLHITLCTLFFCLYFHFIFLTPLVFSSLVLQFFLGYVYLLPSPLLLKGPVYSVRTACPTVEYLKKSLPEHLSVTFSYRQSNIHTHFTPRLVSCAEVRNLSFFILDTTISVTFHANNQVQHYECLPKETVWKYAPLSTFLNNITSPPWLWRPTFPSAFECGCSEQPISWSFTIGPLLIPPSTHC